MRLTFTLFATAACAIASAQAMSIADILAGGGKPTRMAAKDLPANFTAVQIKISGASDYMSMMMPYMFAGAGGGSNPDLLNAFSTSWTSGEVITVENARFLVTYKPELDFAVLAVRGTGLPSTSHLSDHLILELVRVDSISSMTPHPLFTKNRLIAALTKDPEDGMETVPETATGSHTAMPSGLADRKAMARNNYKQVALGAMLYAADYDDYLPYAQTTATVQSVTNPYLKSGSVWRNPNPNGGRILFNTKVGGVSMVEFDMPTEIPMFYDEKAWPDGSRMVAYLDAHVESVPASGWAAVQKQLNRKWKRKGKPLPLPKS